MKALNPAISRSEDPSRGRPQVILQELCPSAAASRYIRAQSLRAHSPSVCVFPHVVYDVEVVKTHRRLGKTHPIGGGDEAQSVVEETLSCRQRRSREGRGFDGNCVLVCNTCRVHRSCEGCLHTGVQWR